MRLSISVRIALFVLAGASAASAQDLAAWVEGRTHARVSGHLAAEQLDQDKDTESPSISKSTSLVDQTDAPDLLSLGMSLYDAANVNSEKAPITMTLSGWALRNAVTQQNPLNPTVYQQGGNWRRWSVTIGRELEEGTNGAARVFGAKVLAWNQRDVSAVVNRDRITKLNELLKSAAQTTAAVLANVQEFVYLTLRSRVKGGSDALSRLDFLKTHLNSANFNTTIALLTDDERADIDGMLPDLVAVDDALTAEVTSMVKAIRGAPQLAFTYQTRQRPDTLTAAGVTAAGTDEHRFAAAFDYGPTDFLTLAVNGSFDLEQIPDADEQRGGRLAVEFAWAAAGRASAGTRAAEILRARRSEDKSPITLSVAGELEWRSELSSVRRLQAKLTLPIPALKGVALPISVTFANDPELIEENDVRGQVGFTLDFSQLKNGLSRH